MKSIILPILWNTDESFELEKLGVISTGLFQINQIRFYNIDFVAPSFINDGNVKSLIYSSGQCFECVLDADEVNKLIEKAFK